MRQVCHGFGNSSPWAYDEGWRAILLLPQKESNCVQVVKLKEEYIANLEKRPPVDNDDDEGRPSMNRSLHAALW